MNCKSEDCNEKIFYAGYCKHCYYQITVHGKVLTVIAPTRTPVTIHIVPDCIVPSCDGIHYAKGYCRLHYSRKRQGISMSGPSRQLKMCRVDNCKEPYYAKHYCRMHYTQLNSNGIVAIERAMKDSVCIVPGCTEMATTKLMCQKHRRQMREKGHIRDSKVLCITTGCTRVHYAKGLCYLCYNKETYRKRTVRDENEHYGYLP